MKYFKYEYGRNETQYGYYTGMWPFRKYYEIDEFDYSVQEQWFARGNTPQFITITEDEFHKATKPPCKCCHGPIKVVMGERINIAREVFSYLESLGHSPWITTQESEFEWVNGEMAKLHSETVRVGDSFGYTTYLRSPLEYKKYYKKACLICNTCISDSLEEIYEEIDKKLAIIEDKKKVGEICG